MIGKLLGLAAAGTGAATLLGEHHRRVLMRPSIFGRHGLDFEETDMRRRAVVIGAGIVGIATALQLSRRGYVVVVVDSSDGPGQECSAVSAGGCVRSNHIADVHSMIDTFKSVLGLSDFQFFSMNFGKCLTDPHFGRWILSFLGSSVMPDAKRQNDMLGFTNFAIDELGLVMHRENIADKCGYKDGRGEISLNFKDENDKNTSTDKNKSYEAENASSSLEPSAAIDAETLIKLEPWLADLSDKLISGSVSPEASSGDSERTTIALAEIAEGLGVRFAYNTHVKALEVGESSDTNAAWGSEMIVAVHTDKGSFVCDANTEVVVAAGSWTPNILWTAGLYIPIYPLKGYSITMDLPPATNGTSTAGATSRLPETDLLQRIIADKYIYGTRLGDQIRVASMGEFDGWNSTPTEHVDNTFRNEASKLFPRMSKMMADTPSRCGLRPFSSDGIVLLGRVSNLDNLAVSVGPGFNGWKTAVGSAVVLADVLEHKHVEYEDFDVESLAPKGVKRAPVLSRLALARHTTLNWKEFVPEALAKMF